MASIIDFEKRRRPLTEQRKDARTEELKQAFRAARQETAAADPLAQTRATRKLLDLYRKKPPGSS